MELRVSCAFSTLAMAGKPVGKGISYYSTTPSPRSFAIMVGKPRVVYQPLCRYSGRYINVGNEELLLTDEHVLSPDSKSLYVYPHTAEDTRWRLCSNWVLQEIRVGYGWKVYPQFQSLWVLFTWAEAGRKSESVPYQKEVSKSHPFVIPAKGRSVKVYPWNVTLLCVILSCGMRESGLRQRDTLLVGGQAGFGFIHSRRIRYWWHPIIR